MAQYWDLGSEANLIRTAYLQTVRTAICIIVRNDMQFPNVWAKWTLQSDGDKIGVT